VIFCSCDIDSKVHENEKIQNKYGFEYSTPYVDGQEVVRLDNIVKGGVFWNAGVRSGDIIETDLSVSSFHNLFSSENSRKAKIFKIRRRHDGNVQTIDIRIESMGSGVSYSMGSGVAY
jgi:hypothetical protein